MQKYLFSYQYGNTSWAFDVFAHSEDDAIAKVKAMSNATFDGTWVCDVPADTEISYTVSQTTH